MWIHRDAIDANDYNPNHVAPPEMRLLKRSILADGWLFPVLVCPPAPSDVTDKPYVIVDGYHRWKVSGDKASCTPDRRLHAVRSFCPSAWTVPTAWQ